ncbi:MAG TPA: ABC transporter ATP-binding protein [Candidatus Dormibacteraeota bacterium]
MSEAITATAVSKRFWKLDEAPTLVGSLLNRSSRTELWALRDVSLTLHAGEALGVIGRNGSGKTTLLKLLAGITQPTHGRIRVVGRVAPLVSVGVGFRAEMTGRENVLLNGMLLGLTRTEVRQRFDQIVDFAELWDFIDTPVKFYSSGMFVRLGFAVAVHTSPDILLVDEVLAVGDIAFQVKCTERIREIQDRGATVVMVSHAIGAVRAISDRVLLLDHGEVRSDGDVEEGIGRYHELLSSDRSENLERVMSEGEKIYTGGATIVERRLIGPHGPMHYAHRDQRLRVEASVRFDTDVESPMFAMQVIDQSGHVVYAKHSRISFEYHRYRAGQEAEMSCEFDPALGGGTYWARCVVLSNDGRRILALDDRGEAFFIEPTKGASGAADLGGVVLVDGIDTDVLAEDEEARAQSLRQ